MMKITQYLKKNLLDALQNLIWKSVLTMYAH